MNKPSNTLTHIDQNQNPTPWMAVLSALTTPRPATKEDLIPSIFQEASKTDLAFEDLNLKIYNWGEEGPQVLLVHGWESRGYHWKQWIGPLLRSGCRVAAIDLPAHGLSGGSTANVIQAGRAVLHLAQHLDPLHSIVGHSMGSAAILYAFAHGLKVKRSVHLAGPASLASVLIRAGRSARLNHEEVEAMITEFEAQAKAPVETMELHALEKGFDHAALLLHDPQDPEVPFSESKMLASAWPESKLVEIQGVGHRRILSDESVIHQSIKFLDLPNEL